MPVKIVEVNVLRMALPEQERDLPETFELRYVQFCVDIFFRNRKLRVYYL